MSQQFQPTLPLKSLLACDRREVDEAMLSYPECYIKRNRPSSPDVTRGTVAAIRAVADSDAMRNTPGHFIKEWRLSRNLSLRKLADRLVSDTFEPVISYASLSRIEKGEQPYSHEILEAIAEALGTSPASLLIFDPTRDSGLLTIWDKIPVRDRATALKVLSGFMVNNGKSGTDG